MTKEEKKIKKQKAARTKTLMEVCRTVCSASALLLSLYANYHNMFH
jgi:hypothetical protein